MIFLLLIETPTKKGRILHIRKGPKGKALILNYTDNN